VLISPVGAGSASGMALGAESCPRAKLATISTREVKIAKVGSLLNIVKSILDALARSNSPLSVYIG
jgi:hypothetical protein